MKKSLILLLGSNEGDRMNNLDKARLLLHTNLGEVQLASSVYRTKAWGKTDQADFLNQVVVIPYAGKATDALATMLTIERKLGRERNEKWGPRTIDIDMLYFGNEIYKSPELTVPHPALHIRRFTLVPLVEIMPEFIHPVFNKSQLQLLHACTDNLEVRKVN
ncbi:MAG: 2-amino-4-hydroxy-6-hydroxymethyldihydropteridine diphosphokinase [Cyclobacteriaceae bacterium]|nr:2-amino-4-hydroxy-6-hydroxymethyldihydropteridine diphosphokinase [Cyclobacteriaceae bacterium]